MTDSSLDETDLDRLLQSPKQWPNYNNYQPLDPSRKEIRVMKIWHENQGNEIHASVSHKSLQTESEYDALSYYWGPPDQQKPIYIEGQPILIRRSLYSFLNALCHHKQDLPVWLDSICINQCDVRERNSQVAMMGNIYRSAACVKAWIGESDADLEYLFAYLRNRYTPQLLNLEHFSEVVKRAKGSLREVLSRPYWKRLWIIQEIGLANKAVVLAGERVVDLDELINFAVDELAFGTFLHSLSGFRKQKGLLKCENVPEHEGTRQNYKARSPTTEGLTHQDLFDRWLSSETLLGLMSAFGNHLCEDPRDKIFGLISLSNDENSIEVDYERTLGELVSQLLHALLQRYADIIGSCESSPYAIPLSLFNRMLGLARRVATSASFEIKDLIDLKQAEGHVLCCEIDEVKIESYEGHQSAWRTHCRYFRKWREQSIQKLLIDCPIEMPLPNVRNWLDKSSGSANDTNSIIPIPDQKDMVCFYIGDRVPDLVQCHRYGIGLMNNILSPPPRITPEDEYPDQVLLLVEYQEKRPRVAGVIADASWWQTLLKWDNVHPVDVWAVLLLEEEVQLCSKTVFVTDHDSNLSWPRLRLHCSRRASMMMLAVGPSGSTETSIAKAIKNYRAPHPQPHLCTCEYNLKDNALIYRCVRQNHACRRKRR